MTTSTVLPAGAAPGAAPLPDPAALRLTLVERRQARADQIEALTWLLADSVDDIRRARELASARAELARVDAALDRIETW